jgi:hypothetical protein
MAADWGNLGVEEFGNFKTDGAKRLISFSSL